MVSLKFTNESFFLHDADSISTISGVINKGFGTSSGFSPGIAFARIAVLIAPGFNKLTFKSVISTSFA